MPELQLYLASNPEAGDVIQGTGGFRKEKQLLKAAVDEEKRQRARRRGSRRK